MFARCRFVASAALRLRPHCASVGALEAAVGRARQPATAFVRQKGTVVGDGARPSTFSITAPDLDATKAIADIPEPPVPLSQEQMAELQYQLGSQLEYLGLGNWTPSGLVQMLLSNVHELCGIPWWAAILACTAAIRLLTTPLLVYSQRNSAAMNEFTAGMQKLNQQLMDAKKRRDKFSEEMHLVELQEYLQNSKGGQLYLKMFGISAAQGSIFLTYFIALRGMSYAPVLSMKEGGLAWVTDLTLADPTWILPIYSSLSVALILELGIETGMSTASVSKMKWVMRLVPVAMFLFIKSYPAAMLFHWCVSNTYSLLVALILQIPAVRRQLNIPHLRRSIFSRFKKSDDDAANRRSVVDPMPQRRSGAGAAQTTPKTTLKKRMKALYTEYFAGTAPSESKVRQTDARNFARAGKHAPQPTFPYNPVERFPAEYGASKRGWREFFHLSSRSKKNQ